MSGADPEETMPFTHSPYGSDEQVDPTTSPDGTSVQPSGASYVPPSAPPPSMASTPYGAPMPDQPATAGWGAVYHGQQHPGASRARTLGIVALISAAVAFFCCITFPGSSARRSPGRSAGRPSGRSTRTRASTPTAARRRRAS